MAHLVRDRVDLRLELFVGHCLLLDLCGIRARFEHLQGPSEYILTDYGAVHWGVNLGVGWKAAVNFAFRDWRKAAQSIHCVYRNLELSAGVKRNYRCVPDFDMIERKELQSDFRRFKAT